jgi:predicted GNAT family N-acyltransferase
MVDVAPVTTARQLAEALALRYEVLVGEQGVDASEARDEFDRDPTTLHCIVVGPDGECIGAGRLTAPVDGEINGEVVEGIPSIGPIVVTASARTSDVARSILAYLEAEALALYGRNGTVRVELRSSVNVQRDAWAPGLGGAGSGAVPAAASHAVTGLAASPFPRRAPGKQERREARA